MKRPALDPHKAPFERGQRRGRQSHDGSCASGACVANGWQERGGEAKVEVAPEQDGN